MDAGAFRKMSVATGVFAVVFEPSCGMLWLHLVTASCYAALQWRSVMLFHVAAMSLVFGAVQSASATVQVAISYACFFVSLDGTSQVVPEEDNSNETP